MACNGLKKGPFHLFRHPTRSRINFRKTHFKSFLTIFSSQNNPFSRHFVTLEGPKWLAMGSKRAHFTCLGTLDGLGLFLENTFLTLFLSQNSPFSRKFGIVGGPKHATMSSKRAKNTCLGIPCGPRSF